MELMTVTKDLPVIPSVMTGTEVTLGKQIFLEDNLSSPVGHLVKAATPMDIKIGVILFPVQRWYRICINQVLIFQF